MKVSEIIGRKVFTINSGLYIENVDDVVYDPKINAITAVLIDRGGWFSDAKVILFKDIKTIGHDAILIDNEQVVKKASQLVPSITEIVKGNTFLTSTKIITESGNALGTISDLLFDPKTGTVSDLEVSQGAIKNIQSGKKCIPISNIVTIGKDRIIVTSATENQIQNQAQQQGVQGAVKKAHSQATKSAENTKQTSSEAAQSMQSGIKTISQKAKQKLKEFNQQPAMKQLKQNLQETKQNIQSSVNGEKSISQNGQKTVFKNTDSNEKNSDAQQHTHV